MPEKSTTYAQEAGNVVMMLTPICADVASVPPYATAESPAQSKKMTLHAKSSSCVKDSQKPKSSKTVAPGSISKGAGCAPYWSDLCAETSSKLWLPTETVFADSDSISFATSSNSQAAKSWFSTTRKKAPVSESLTTSLTISLQSSTSSPAESTGVVVTRTRKNRLNPTRVQKKLFKSWIGCARYVYNKTIEYLRQPETKASWLAIKGPILAELPAWCDSVPYQIKSLAIEDACNAVKAAKKKFMITGDFQKVSYKTRKSPRQSINIPGSAISSAGIYPRLSGSGLRYSESLPQKRIGTKSKSGSPTLADGRLLFENGRWYLCIPEKITISRPENQGRIVAIDPGVRTFATFYSPDECGQIGNGDFSRLVRLSLHMDDIISRLSKKRKVDRVTAHRRHRMRKAVKRLRAKFNDLVDELHWKTIRFLVDNFDVILLPTFEVSEMVTKVKRRIRSKTVRAMLSLAHYRFAQRLEWKAASLGKTVLRVNEAYTSKTASWTGEIVHNLGGAKKIRSGGQVVNRDINGARGIFLRALVDQPSLFSLEDNVQC